jgi:putative phage-type endonuclease
MIIRDDIEQGSEAWHVWRSQGVGSSDVVAIAMHVGLVERQAWASSITDLYEEKVGLVARESLDNWRMRRGHTGEGFVRAVAARRLGEDFSPKCIEMGEDVPEMRVSLDGLNFVGDHVLECKNPSEKVHELALQGEVVSYYKPQICHQGICTFGHPEGWKRDEHLITFASGAPEHPDETKRVALVTRDVYAYREMSLSLYPAVMDFIQCVREKIPPLGEDFMAAATMFRMAKTRESEAKALSNEARAKMLKIVEKLGLTNARGNGVSVSWFPESSEDDLAAYAMSLNPTAEQLEPFKKKRKAYWVVK